MALKAKELADKLMKGTKPAGNETTPSMIAYAEGIIAALQSAVVVNLPGTILGVTAPGAPLSAGSGMGGTMLVLPAAMIAKTARNFDPKAVAGVSKENTAICNYLSTGLVMFAAGKVTGTCTNTPVSPGPLVAGKADDGKITGLVGAAAAAMVGAQLGGMGPEGIDFYTTLINYILDKAEVSYPLNGIVGVCPLGGGPLTAGAGIGGIIK